MTIASTTSRMLLSHNFNVNAGIIPALSRAGFTQVFVEALSDCAKCRLVENPHWIVEVLFDADKIAPAQLGDRYLKALAEHRQSTLDSTIQLPQYLALGGLKTTPAMTSSPDSLQPNDWGVDVVETGDADRFLEGLGWDTAIADRPVDHVFKSVLKP